MGKTSESFWTEEKFIWLNMIVILSFIFFISYCLISMVMPERGAIGETCLKDGTCNGQLKCVAAGQTWADSGRFICVTPTDPRVK